MKFICSKCNKNECVPLSGYCFQCRRLLGLSPVKLGELKPIPENAIRMNGDDLNFRDLDTERTKALRKEVDPASMLTETPSLFEEGN